MKYSRTKVKMVKTFQINNISNDFMRIVKRLKKDVIVWCNEAKDIVTWILTIFSFVEILNLVILE